MVMNTINLTMLPANAGIPFGEVMTIGETVNSCKRGNAIAATLREPSNHFRFPLAIFHLMRAKGFAHAAGKAMDWKDNPRLTIADAYEFVKKLRDEAKQLKLERET